MKLSILICTMPSRKDMYNDLMGWLYKDMARLPEGLINEVEILVNDNTDISIGAKRNELLERAKGDFIVYIDDDDMVSRVYIYTILSCISENPDIDCVGISGVITTNGNDLKQWYISKDYGRWYEEYGVYYRTPNHISPVRREIALKVKFPDVMFSEDAVYSAGILPYLKKEAKVGANIYHYRFISNK